MTDDSDSSQPTRLWTTASRRFFARSTLRIFPNSWHYSVVGQYTELALAAAGRLAGEIESRLFGNLDEHIQQASDTIATMQETAVRAVVAQCIDDEVQLLDDDQETRMLPSVC